jgi:NADPH:quinone reductase-like Zn-dependent oxidoreductase
MQALRDVGHVTAGQHVLIIGASGGVGTYAVQVAKAFGARVTGVCSTAKVDLVRSIGADEVIDYTREDFAAGTPRFDLILDIGGNSRISRLRRVLAPNGTLVIVGGEGGRWTGVGRQIGAVAVSPLVPQRLATFVNKERRADLDAVRELIETGQVTPIVDRTYPLVDVPDALRHLEAGRARGKIAISI